MNRQDLIAAIAEKTGVTKKEADAVVKAFTEVVMDDVAAGNKVQLIGFGTFESVERAAREGRNPRTNETMTIAASWQSETNHNNTRLRRYPVRHSTDEFHSGPEPVL